MNTKLQMAGIAWIVFHMIITFVVIWRWNKKAATQLETIITNAMFVAWIFMCCYIITQAIW